MSSAMTPLHQRQAHALARLASANPFSDAWTALEAEALGEAFAHRARPWSLGADAAARAQNLGALEALTADLVARLRRRVEAGVGGADLLALYRELALFHLYNQAIAPLDELIAGDATRRVPAYRELKRAYELAFAVDARAHPGFDAAHWFAGCYQLRRAFFHIFRFIVGSSRASARLRGAVWEAIFTADAGRYRRALVLRMRDVPTLVLGETGTGKELVARAIGLSGFVPFLEDRLQFAGDPNAAFLPMHLAAHAPTLVESALFGHKKGAFTGALEDREGVFAACPPWGAVFLDEVGELELGVQSKLLRVLETRDFAPLGRHHGGQFRGRLIAATNRDLTGDVDAGRFRADMYFRMAGVVVQTPPLRARIDDDAEELPLLVRYLAQQIAGPDEGDALAAAALAALTRVPEGYPWPGNVRELAQQVRAVLVHGALDAAALAKATPADWLARARAGALTVDELITGYVRHVHAQVGSYDGTAKRIGLDRRTVKARLQGGRP
ncbi:MAG: sigma-54-dependent Fis family transcriptional regulator [Deltaproteobacteria bacterium]|nr:sigma-54-dependent Fis family transcriptional regulator [Deltaproteobacteria bacterium]